MSVQLIRRSDTLHDTPGQMLGVFSVSDFRLDERKLVAPEARNRVTLSGARP
jgi:hypothetical protein